MTDEEDETDELEERNQTVRSILGTPGGDPDDDPDDDSDDDHADAPAATGSGSSTGAASTPATSSGSSTSGSSGSGRPTTPTTAEGGPPFSFDDAAKETVYVRPASWTLLQARAKALEAELIEEEGIDDLAGREVHDAMARVAADRPDLLREAILDAREGP